jgi:hypothetical protein
MKNENNKILPGISTEEIIEKTDRETSIPSFEDVILPLSNPGEKHRGRPKKSEKNLKTKEEYQQELAEKLFKTEIWKPVACLPFDLLYLQTKFEGFLLSPEESERSGFLLAKVLEICSPEFDPKYMVLSAFAIDYLTLISKKGMAWNTWRKTK